MAWGNRQLNETILPSDANAWDDGTDKAKAAIPKTDFTRVPAVVTTSGTSTALTAIIENFTLSDMNSINIKLHVDIGAEATININSLGAKSIYTSDGVPIKAKATIGSMLTLAYNAALDRFYVTGGMISLDKIESKIDTINSDLGKKADKTNVLERNNTVAFTPTSDYHPATKKYVDASNTQINDIKSSPRNLLLNSGNYTENTDISNIISGVNWNLSLHHKYLHCERTSVETFKLIRFPLTKTLEASTTLTIFIKAKGQSTTAPYVFIGSLADNTVGATFPLSSNFSVQKVTFNVPSTGEYVNLVFSSTQFSTIGDYIDIEWMAVYEGEVTASVWSPAPEDIDKQISELSTSINKLDEYGLFVDNRPEATNGCWHKLFTIKVNAYSYTDISVSVKISNLYNSTLNNSKRKGTLNIAIRQEASGVMGGSSCITWESCSGDISSYIEHFAVNVVADSTGNYIEFYAYNNTRNHGYKAKVLDKSVRNPNHTSTFTGYTDWTGVSGITELPTNGTIIYSTLSHNMIALANKADKKYVDKSIGDIDIGGRNYIPNSALTENTEGFISYGLVPDVVLSQYAVVTKSQETANRQGMSVIPLLEHATYTLSGWIYVEESNGELEQSTFAVRTYDDKGNTISDFINIQLNNTSCPLGQWVKLCGTGKPEEKTDFTKNNIVSLSLSAKFVGKVRTKNWKLEKGNKPTDWSPAQEDIENSLANKADKSNVLGLDNTKEFIPTKDYQPATKKYADDGEYGLFVDSRSEATTGYWYKLFACKVSAYSYTDINMNISVSSLYNIASTARTKGKLNIAIRQTASGQLNNASTVVWESCSGDISSKINHFAVNVIPDSTGNYIEFYAYSNVQYAGYKAKVIDKSTSSKEHKLTFTGYTDWTGTNGIIALPTNGTILYSTLSDGMKKLSTISTDGVATSAKKLETARTINGVSFDGSANIIIKDDTKPNVESGTWTPVPKHGSITIDSATYYKVGNLCYITTCFKLSIETGSAVALNLTGFPFTPYDSYQYINGMTHSEVGKLNVNGTFYKNLGMMVSFTPPAYPTFHFYGIYRIS